MDNKNSLNNKSLALFFTTGVSLETWNEVGSIKREVALYNELSKHFKKIYFLTYGNEGDLKYKKYLAENIIIIPKKRINNNIMYSLLIPFIHWRILKNVNILKTNQMWGSWSAVLTKIFYRNKLIVRTGYMLSLNFKKENPNSHKHWLMKLIEKISYSFADAIITSSLSNKMFIEKNYYPKTIHRVIPNYIDVNLFKPLDLTKKKNTIIFVGRLSKEKNLFNLLKSIKELNYKLGIIGSGPLKNALVKYKKENDIEVEFYGNIPNEKIPLILNQYEIFILPSLYENMPKSLLEAMACGMPVVGTDVKGINEVITHNYNGILCNTDPDSIKEAICKIKDNNLKIKISFNARKTTIDKYSFKKIFEKEKTLMDKLS